MLFLTTKNDVYVYNLNGIFVSNYSLGDSNYESISTFGNGYVCSSGHLGYVTGEKAKLFTYFDSSFGEITRKQNVLPYQIVFPPMVSSCFQKVGNILYYVDVPTYRIFMLDMEDKSADRSIRVDLFNPMPTESFKRVNIFNDEFRKYCFIKDFTVSRTNFIVSYVDRSRSCIAIADTTGATVLNGKIKTFLPKTFYNENDDYLYTPIDYIDYKKQWSQRCPMKAVTNKDDKYDVMILKWRVRR